MMPKRDSIKPTKEAAIVLTNPASLLPRLGALLYDALLTTILLVIAGAIGVGIAHLLLWSGMVTLPQGSDIKWLLTSPIYSAWLAFVLCGFYTWLWTQSGQTPGMTAWNLRIQNHDGSRISVTQALIRLATSAFGLGNLLCLFNQNSPRAFQDIWAECEVVKLDN